MLIHLSIIDRTAVGVIVHTLRNRLLHTSLPTIDFQKNPHVLKVLNKEDLTSYLPHQYEDEFTNYWPKKKPKKLHNHPYKRANESVWDSVSIYKPIQRRLESKAHPFNLTRRG
eukprot:Protomagalhaensia_wolfi_Nauph_80__6237@NODE_942_length_1863_cov_40_594846_g403_i4_p2_GENE_NODE_942_length_1863_cov_40_594846_g403_i4NODE_942_length_1863_cov_40_594846_g403_i4_p2_ORF_typecomplete_len113_score5_25_NODE_942_length_1863_cov_40_594846_g403_i47481086